MYLHENIHVTDWFYIYFTENQRNGFRNGIIWEIVSYPVPYRGCNRDYMVSG